MSRGRLVSVLLLSNNNNRIIGAMMITVSHLVSDRDNYMIYLVFTYPPNQKEYILDIDFDPRLCFFHPSGFQTPWVDYDHLIDHPEISEIEVDEVLQKWITENQDNILRWVLDNNSWFVDLIKEEKHYFISHCGFTYLGSQLRKILTHPIHNQAFRNAYRRTFLKSDCSDDLIENFDRTIDLIDDTDIFIGENDASDFHSMHFIGFRNLSRGEGKISIIDFDTKEIGISM